MIQGQIKQHALNIRVVRLARRAEVLVKGRVVELDIRYLWFRRFVIGCECIVVFVLLSAFSIAANRITVGDIACREPSELHHVGGQCSSLV